MWWEAFESRAFHTAWWWTHHRCSVNKLCLNGSQEETHSVGKSLSKNVQKRGHVLDFLFPADSLCPSPFCSPPWEADHMCFGWSPLSCVSQEPVGSTGSWPPEVRRELHTAWPLHMRPGERVRTGEHVAEVWGAHSPVGRGELTFLKYLHRIKSPFI